MRSLVTAAFLTASAVSAQTPQSPASKTFSPSEEVNRVLPSWIKVGGEFRTRFEGFTGGSFKANTTDAYTLSRLKLNVTMKPTSWLTFFGEGYDARAIGKSPALPPFQNTWDIRQAYAEFGDSEKKTFGLRVGRQEFNFGDQRLIGALPWANTARTFDAVRGTFHVKGFRADVFSASVVNQTDGTWDHHLQGNNLHGIYTALDKLIPNATIEPYAFWRLQPRVKNEAGIVANVDEKVTGVRWVGKLPLAFDYGLEAVNEAGSLGSDKISAWATHFVIGRTTKSFRATPRIFAEFNFASGDKNAKDGTRGTFDQLYPTGHDKYGLSDQVGWRNMKDFRTGIETKPRRNVTAAVVYNDLYLASSTDALYNAAGAAVFRSLTGTAGTHIGQELDVIATWTIIKPLVAGAGFAHLFPGQFLKNVTPGMAYNYPYVMFTYKF
jgi:hypothetical protein